MLSLFKTNQRGQSFKLVEVFNTKECPCTAIILGAKRIIVDHDIHDISQAWYNWQIKGAFIQDAFHMLNVHEREFIKTGIDEEEWAEIFKEKEE